MAKKTQPKIDRTKRNGQKVKTVAQPTKRTRAHRPSGNRSNRKQAQSQPKAKRNRPLTKLKIISPVSNGGQSKDANTAAQSKQCAPKDVELTQPLSEKRVRKSKGCATGNEQAHRNRSGSPSMLGPSIPGAYVDLNYQPICDMASTRVSHGDHTFFEVYEPSEPTHETADKATQHRPLTCDAATNTDCNGLSLQSILLRYGARLHPRSDSEAEPCDHQHGESSDTSDMSHLDALHGIRLQDDESGDELSDLFPDNDSDELSAISASPPQRRM